MASTVLARALVAAVLVAACARAVPVPTATPPATQPPAPSPTPVTPSRTHTPGPAQLPNVVSSLITEVRHVDLPGAPTDVAVVDEQSGYVAMDTGGIAHFRIDPHNGEISVTTVVEELEHGRGVAVIDDRLFAIELGPICSIEGAQCNPLDPAKERFGPDDELNVLANARAKLISFAIGADGSLDDRRTEIDGLPVVGYTHAANGLTAGPDGNLYLAIGNVDALWRTPERLAEVDLPNREWLGTVLRIDPVDGSVSIHVSGLRNVYKVAFDEDGDMWAVDNNGPAIDGWRAEEVLLLEHGRNYGHPFEGTYGAKGLRDGFPVWVSSTVGSAGLTSSEPLGLGPGLLVGGCQRLVLLQGGGSRLWPKGHGQWVETELLHRLRGCLTGIAPIAGAQVVATLYPWGSEPGRLYLLRFGP